jgi:predicted amidohydrolase
MSASSSPLRVATAQIPVGADLVANLAAILEAMNVASAAGAALIVCPEAALTGYAPAIGRTRAAGEWPAVQAALAAVAQRAGVLGLWAAVGADYWGGDAWRNSCWLFDAAGGLAARYDKVHLFPPDRPYYRGGETPAPVVNVHGAAVGLQICYDLRFPEGYRGLLHGGAQVVVQGFYGLGAAWKRPVMAGHLRSRAAENGCFMVAANVAGAGGIVTSQIVDPLGEVLAEAEPDAPALVVADLDLARVAASEIRRDYLDWFRPR